METPENVQFVRLCLFPRVHFGVQFTSPMCPFSWVQFNPLMGQKMGQKWVRKNEALKKVQKIRRFHQKSADFWSEWRDLNPRPLGPELPFVTISSQNVSNICIFVLFCEPLCPIRLHLSILKWVSSVRENGSSHRELCGKEKE